MDGSPNNLLALLTALPLLAGILTTLVRPRIRAQRAVGVVALGALVGLNGWLCATLPSGATPSLSVVGGWPAPYGIVLAYDGLSGALMLVTGVVGLSCYLAAFSLLPRRLEAGWFHPLFHLLIMGVNFSFLTGDLFNLFVAFEIMLMASYALLTLGSTRAQLSQSYKYVVLNLLGSTIFVLAAGLVYGMMGTLNYADLARMVAEARVGGEALPTGFQSVSVLLLFVFALKAAVFPLWFWLPDTYHTMPAPIAGAFAALLSKVGVYAILRLYPMVFGSPLLEGSPASAAILPLAAGFTMIVAVVGAIGAVTIRRILAMVLMAHVGYLLFGVSLMTGPSHAATLWYMAQEMLVMGGLFVSAGMVIRHAGTDDLREMSGVAARAPLLGWVTLTLLLALAGMPPLAGFFAKALLVREGVSAGAWWLTAATLATAVVTLLAALRIWCHGFWMPLRGARLETPPGAVALARPSMGWAFAGLMILTGSSVAVGLAAPVASSFTARATAELTRPESYVEAVLGEGAWPLAAADAEAVASAGAEEATP